MRYILYARKSQEDKLRQVQSINDQMREMRRFAQRMGLTVVKEVYEERSAKSPGRPVFDAMMQSIHVGEAEGILVWSINRLLRNPVDEGTVKWMLQQGKLRSIQTMDKEHTPQDNVLLLGVESGVATQYIVDLRKGVLRGLKSKLEKGWYPHRAPLGYLNNKYEEQGARTIIPDPVAFPLIRKAWDLILIGGYTVPQVMEKMNSTYGTRTSVRRNGSGGKPVPRSTWYRLFSNVFYAGHFMRNGTLYKGSHQAMVSLAEFDRVQRLIGVENPIKPKSHDLAFTGLMRCGMCGGWITGEIKKKPSGKTYTYYHCQNSKGTCGRAGVREERLMEQIGERLARVSVSQPFYEWAIEILNEEVEREEVANKAGHDQHERAMQEVEKQLAALLDLRIRDLVTDEEYSQKKEGLLSCRASAQLNLAKAGESAETVRRALLSAAEFVFRAREQFVTGDAATRRATARALGSDHTLTAGILALKGNYLLSRIEKEYPALKARYETIELDKTLSVSTKKQHLDAVRLTWYG
jgi:site-specific DNA recombinase